MQKIANKKTWGYIGRFLLIHVITYSIIGILFLLVQDRLPTSNKMALEFYKPYRPLSFTVLFAQGLRGAVLAIILLPFQETIVKGNYGSLVLFGALWGLGVLGSLEPLPGSIEGLIYTETTLMEHFMVLTASAVQIILFIRLFLCWEHKIVRLVDYYD